MKSYYILFIYAIIWIAVSAAIIVGIFITKDANCLWAFLLPLCATNITYKYNSTKDENTDNDNEFTI